MQHLNETEKKELIKAKLIRGFYMLIFLICGWLGGWLTVAVTIFQFLSNLITDHPNENLAKFGKSLSIYFSQVVQYLSYNTEIKPFPFSAWPFEAKVLETSHSKPGKSHH